MSDEFTPQPQSRFWGWTLAAWLLFIAVLAGLLLLTGCVTTGELRGTCAFQYAGQESNVHFVRYHCKPVE